MKIFLPSFFKIRVVVLTIAFFLLCFFVGLLKNLFATGHILSNGDCYFYTFQTTPVDLGSSKKLIAKIHPTHDFSNIWFELVVNTPQEEPDYRVTMIKHKWDGSSWLQYNPNPNGSFSTQAKVDEIKNQLSQWGISLNQWPNSSAPSGCTPSPCEDEKNQAIIDCGGDENVDWDTWNESDCTGECKISINANLGSPDYCYTEIEDTFSMFKEWKLRKEEDEREGDFSTNKKIA